MKKESGGKDAKCWRIFNQLYIEEKLLNFVQCTSCSSLLFYNSKSGNSSLNRHMNSCTSKSKITQFFKLKNTLVSSEDRQRIKLVQSNFTIRTMSPFALNDNPALADLANEFIRIGAKYGNIKAEEVLFSRKTITENCKNLAAQQRVALKEKISNLPDESYCLASDIWSSRNGDSFLQIHIIYIEGFELKVFNNHIMKLNNYFLRINVYQ